MNLSKLLLSSALAVAAALPAVTARAADPEFLVLDWASFEIPGVLQGYVDKYGQNPTYTIFGDDDEAFQKIASGFRSDVVHPCSQMIQKYRDAGLIEPWDVSKIPAFADIDPAFLGSKVFQDEGGVWYIPTDWGSTAIAYNKEKVPEEDVKSLNVFVDPKYAGRISLPDNTDDVWALALLATGVHDWTNLTDEQYNAALEWLRQANANVRAYWVDPGELAQLMASGEVLVGWSWPDPVSLLKADNFPVGFTREAAEGSTSWFCGYVNVKDGPGKEEKAYDFINSWLRPEAAPALLDAIGYGHSTLKGQELVGAAKMEEAGLGKPSTPVLPQVPLDIAKREQMVADFEKVKAGF